MNVIFLVGTASVISYCLYLILFVLIHLKNKEYSFTKHALSDYDIGSTHGLFQIYNFFGSFGALLLAGAFFFSTEPFHKTIPLFLISMIICRAGVSIFKTNIEGEKITFTAILHYLFAIGSFALAYIIIDKVNTLVLKQELSHGIDLIIKSYNYALTAILIGVCITMFKPLRRFFAVIERLYILLVGLWFLVISFVFAITGKL
jgi:hypothetical protein